MENIRNQQFGNQKANGEMAANSEKQRKMKPKPAWES